jgi:hypothetical protein
LTRRRGQEQGGQRQKRGDSDGDPLSSNHDRENSERTWAGCYRREAGVSMPNKRYATGSGCSWWRRRRRRCSDCCSEGPPGS